MGAQPNILSASNGETRPNALVYGLSRELIEALPAALYMTDAEGRITFYKEAADSLWGCRPEVGDSKFSDAYKLYARRSALNSNAARPFIPYPTIDATARLTGAINMLVEKYPTDANCHAHRRDACILSFPQIKGMGSIPACVPILFGARYARHMSANVCGCR